MLAKKDPALVRAVHWVEAGYSSSGLGPWHIVVPSPHVRPQRVLMLGGAEKGWHTGMLCVKV
jgi:hypothetical protein